MNRLQGEQLSVKNERGAVKRGRNRKRGLSKGWPIENIVPDSTRRGEGPFEKGSYRLVKRVRLFGKDESGRFRSREIVRSPAAQREVQEEKKLAMQGSRKEKRPGRSMLDSCFPAKGGQGETPLASPMGGSKEVLRMRRDLKEKKKARPYLDKRKREIQEKFLVKAA